MIALNINNIIQ